MRQSHSRHQRHALFHNNRQTLARIDLVHRRVSTIQSPLPCGMRRLILVVIRDSFRGCPRKEPSLLALL